MALRKWRPRKRCCQVQYTLAKEPTIKVELKALPQLLFLVALAEDCSAVLSMDYAGAEVCSSFHTRADHHTIVAPISTPWMVRTCA